MPNLEAVPTAGTMSSQDKVRLTKQQEAFCEAFFATGNAQKSALVAGYKHPEKVGVTIRADGRMRRRLHELSEVCLEDLKARRGKLITELETIAYSDVGDFVQVNNGAVTGLTMPADKQGALKSIKETRNGIEIQMHDKLRAIETLARISGLLVDKVDVTSAGQPLRAPVNVTFNVIPSRNRITDAEVTDVTDD